MKSKYFIILAILGIAIILVSGYFLFYSDNPLNNSVTSSLISQARYALGLEKASTPAQIVYINPTNNLKGSGQTYIKKKYKFTKQLSDSIVNTSFQQINNDIIEITLNKLSNPSGGYKWNTVVCSPNDTGFKFQVEDNGGGFNYATWQKPSYQNLTNFGFPSNWCSETKGMGYAIFKSGSGNQLPSKFRLNITDKAYLYAGSGTEITYIISENIVSYNYTYGITDFTLIRQNNSLVTEGLFVFFNESKYKFGANDSLNTNLSNYTYIINSTQELVDISTSYPMFYNYHQENGSEIRFVYDFIDICLKNYSNCTWKLSPSLKTLYVNFTSDKYIDPTITNVTGCLTLSNSDTIYRLNRSISSTGTCLVINNNSIAVDCMNFDNTIVYGNSSSSSGYVGISAIGMNYTNITNCNIFYSAVINCSNGKPVSVPYW